jgi:hypothetical protein
MPPLARVELESLLRTRQLDRTLTTALPAPREPDVVGTGQPDLDVRLGGGIPRGALSEIVGPSSSGRTSLACAAISAATRQGELVALVDACDSFDPESAARTGVELARLLWIRGDDGPDPERSLQRAVKALNLVLQGGLFGLVILDMTGIARRAIGRLPFTTWMRLERVIGARTACVLLAGAPVARSAAGLTIALGPGSRARWTGQSDRARLLEGLEIRARVLRARAVPDDRHELVMLLG